MTASQRLEMSGARGARADAAAGTARAAMFSYRADSLRLSFEVKQAFASALLPQRRESVSRRVAEVFREAAVSARERYEDGDVSLSTLRRIDVERARYEVLLAGAEIEVGVAQRTLALLVDPEGDASRMAAAPLPSDVPPVPPTEGEEPEAVGRRPEFAAARLEVEARTAQARLARAARVPDVTATGGFKRQSDGLRGAFLGLSLPVPLFEGGRERALRSSGSDLVVSGLGDMTPDSLDRQLDRARAVRQKMSTRPTTGGARVAGASTPARLAARDVRLRGHYSGSTRWTGGPMRRRERSLAPRWTALAFLVASAATCGGEEQEVAEPGTMDDVPGISPEREPGTPMAGGDQMQVMQQMRMHMQQMSGAPGDSLMAVMPMHRQMAGQMLAGMDTAAMGRGMQMDSTWRATMDSVRSDLSRMETMSAEELEEFMPTHHARVQRLMSMHDSVMRMR